MISETLQKAINKQICAEMWSASLYLSMSYYFKNLGYDGFAHWMKVQAKEELGHAEMMADYIIKRGGRALVSAIDAVPQKWDSPLAAFEEQHKQECIVSSKIDKLVDLAADENDKATQDFLWFFVREQVEEEDTAQSIIDKIKLGGDIALYHLDVQMGQRQEEDV